MVETASCFLWLLVLLSVVGRWSPSIGRLIVDNHLFGRMEAMRQSADHDGGVDPLQLIAALARIMMVDSKLIESFASLAQRCASKLIEGFCGVCAVVCLGVDQGLVAALAQRKRVSIQGRSYPSLASSIAG